MERAASAIKAARSKGITIAHCRVAFSDSEIANFPSTNMMLSRVKQDPARLALMNENSAEAAFHPKVAPWPGDIVIRKTRIGPFLNGPEDVHALFKKKGIDTLLIGGVATSAAVLATVLQGGDLDYQQLVLEDLCADPDLQTHEFVIEKVLKKRAIVIKSKDLDALVDG